VREHDVDLHVMCVEDQTLAKSNSISSSHLLRHIQCLETIAIISGVQLWWVSMYCFGSITNMYSHNVFSYNSPLPASAPCVWAAVQTKSIRSSKPFMSGDRRSSRQFGGRRMLQSKIIWLGDCSAV